MDLGDSLVDQEELGLQKENVLGTGYRDHSPSCDNPQSDHRVVG